MKIAFALLAYAASVAHATCSATQCTLPIAVDVPIQGIGDCLPAAQVCLEDTETCTPACNPGFTPSQALLTCDNVPPYQLTPTTTFTCEPDGTPLCTVTCVTTGANTGVELCPANYLMTGGFQIAAGTVLTCANSGIATTTQNVRSCTASTPTLTMTCWPVGADIADPNALAQAALTTVPNGAQLTQILAAASSAGGTFGYAQSVCGNCGTRAACQANRLYSCSGCIACNPLNRREESGEVALRQITPIPNTNIVVCFAATLALQTECFRQAVCDGVIDRAADQCGLINTGPPVTLTVGGCPSCSSGSKKGLLGLLGLLGIIPLCLLCLLCLLWLIPCCIRRTKTSGDVFVGTFSAPCDYPTPVASHCAPATACAYP